MDSEEYYWVEAFDRFPYLGLASHFLMQKWQYLADTSTEHVITVNTESEIIDRAWFEDTLMTAVKKQRHQ